MEIDDVFEARIAVGDAAAVVVNSRTLRSNSSGSDSTMTSNPEPAASESSATRRRRRADSHTSGEDSRSTSTNPSVDRNRCATAAVSRATSVTSCPASAYSHPICTPMRPAPRIITRTATQPGPGSPSSRMSPFAPRRPEARVPQTPPPACGQSGGRMVSGGRPTAGTYTMAYHMSNRLGMPYDVHYEVWSTTS